MTMNILLFDNSPEVRTMIQRNLFQISRTLNIVLVENMLSAKEAFNKTVFDIAIIDMDKLDGIFSLFIKTARDTNPDIVVILLSSLPFVRIFEIFINKGADYCFDKTNEFEELIKKIDELLIESYQLNKVEG